MAEALAASIEGAQDLESVTVGIYRTAAVVKGGRRFSFSALVVVGDRRGRVGIGYAKAPGVPAAIEKAQKEARKNLTPIVLQEGTIPHIVEAKFGSSMVRLIPAAPGTGVVAGGTVRAVLEMAGVRDALTKAYGSTNQINLVKATFQALCKLRSKEEVARLRRVDLGTSVVEEMLAKGRRYAPKLQEPSDKPKGPVSKVAAAKAAARAARGRRAAAEEQATAEPDAATSASVPVAAAPASSATTSNTEASPSDPTNPPSGN